MSEPQHPHTQGTQTNAGQSESVATGTKALPASFESLAAAGAQLAHLRAARGWSVDDVSARLKVPSPKMRALEAGDISHLPGTTFALGVVRSYAKMLGVDPAPFTQALRSEKGEPEPDLSMPASTGADLPRGRVSVSLGGAGAPNHRSWWWGVGAVVIALIALVMWHGGGEPPAWLAHLKASANGAAANVNVGASVLPVQSQTVASGAAIVRPEDMSVGANPPAAAVTGGASAAYQGQPSAGPASPAALASAPAVVAPAGASATASVPVPVPVESASTLPAAGVPASGAASLAGAASTITLKTKQDSWFSVRDKSGREVFSGLVRAGDTKAVTGELPFKVVAGNYAGVESIALDGKTVEVAKYAAGKGNVSRFTLP